MRLGVCMRQKWTGRESLAQGDVEVMTLVQKEKHRQRSGLELIASEVIFTLPLTNDDIVFDDASHQLLL